MNFSDNPFFLLAASPRDSKLDIHEKAERKIFSMAENTCRQAEQILTNPKKRLEAEISWFPGISDKQVRDITSLWMESESRPEDFLTLDWFTDYPKLAYSNIIAFFLSKQTSGKFTEKGLEQLVRLLCSTSAGIDAAHTMLLINEDRLIAKIPKIQNIADIEQALENQRHVYKKSIRDYLNLYPPETIVAILTSIVEDITQNGEKGNEWPLLDELIADYEMEATPFFDKEESVIDCELKSLSELLCQKAKPSEFAMVYERIEKSVKTWDRVAQPIQVLMRSQGIDHDRSRRLSEAIRDVALSAHNEFGQTDLSLKLTELQETVFKELRRTIETLQNDKKVLQGILEKEKKDKLQRKKELAYFIEWGWIFKKTLKIDSDGISFNDCHIAFSRLKGVRWGITRHYTNGIPTATEYVVACFSEGMDIRLPIKNQEMFGDVTDRLWKAVGIELILESLKTLKNGGHLEYDEVKVFDDHIEKEESSFWSEKTVSYQWSNLQNMAPYSGFLNLSWPSRGAMISLSYQATYNVHVLDAIVRQFLKNGDGRHLASGFLK